jgi:hypothetical protein
LNEQETEERTTRKEAKKSVKKNTPAKESLQSPEVEVPLSTTEKPLHLQQNYLPSTVVALPLLSHKQEAEAHHPWRKKTWSFLLELSFVVSL